MDVENRFTNDYTALQLRFLFPLVNLFMRLYKIFITHKHSLMQKQYPRIISEMVP